MTRRLRQMVAEVAHCRSVPLEPSSQVADFQEGGHDGPAWSQAAHCLTTTELICYDSIWNLSTCLINGVSTSSPPNTAIPSSGKPAD